MFSSGDLSCSFHEQVFLLATSFGFLGYWSISSVIATVSIEAQRFLLATTVLSRRRWFLLATTNFQKTDISSGDLSCSFHEQVFLPGCLSFSLPTRSNSMESDTDSYHLWPVSTLLHRKQYLNHPKPIIKWIAGRLPTSLSSFLLKWKISYYPRCNYNVTPRTANTSLPQGSPQLASHSMRPPGVC